MSSLDESFVGCRPAQNGELLSRMPDSRDLNDTDASHLLDMDRIRERFFIWQARERALGRPSSLEDAARLVGTEVAVLRKLFRSKNPPSGDLISKVGRLLDVPLDDGMCNSGEGLSIHERLRHALRAWQQERREMGQPWTQEYVASEMGVSQGLISMYLQGRMMLTDSALKRLCGVLHRDPMEISARLAQDGSQTESVALGEKSAGVDLARLRRTVAIWQAGVHRARGLSELATEIGCSIQLLRRYLRGDVPIDIDTLESICEAMDVDSIEFRLSQFGLANDSSLLPPSDIFRNIPYYGIKDCVAGLHHKGKPAGFVAKDRRFFLRKNIRVRDTIALCLDSSVSGKYLIPGDIAFFDCRKCAPDTDGIYLIERNGIASVCALQRDANGVWRIRNAECGESEEEPISGNVGFLVLAKLYFREGG